MFLTRLLISSVFTSIAILAVWYLFGWLAALLMWIGVGIIHIGIVLTIATAEPQQRDD